MAKFPFEKLRSFDVETFGKGELFGLQPWRIRDKTLRIRSYAFSYLLKGKMAQIPVPETSDGGVDRKVLSDQLMECAARGDYLVTWNGTYDIACLLAFGLHKEVQANRWLDAMLLWKRVDPQRFSYGLKTFVEENIPSMAGYAEDIDHSIEVPIKQLVKYNCQDTDATLFAAIKFINQLTDKELRPALIESHDLYDVAYANLRGIPLDIREVAKLKTRLEEEDKEARKILGDSLPEGVNVGSPPQIGKLLYETWGLPIIKRSKKTQKPATDKDTLLELALMDSRARNIIEVRQAKNRMTKYVQRPVESALYHNTANGYQDYGGLGHIKIFITRPEFRKSSTYTGRGTYSSKLGRGKKTAQTGIALHQWARGSEYRSMIIAPPGYKIVEWDYAGQELRWAAELSKDPTLIRLFLEGVDLHSYMGARVSGLSYERITTDIEKGAADFDFQETEEFKASKKARYLGKFTNLSSLYRTGAKKLRIKALSDYGLVMSFSEAQHVRNTFMTTLPGIVSYWDAQIALARSQGYVENVAGRRVYFTPEQWDKSRVWSSESTSINQPIQSIGAEQKNLAMYFLTRYHRQHGGYYFFDLHDGLFSIFPEDVADHHGREVQKILSNLPYEQAWGYKPVLPFPVDCASGFSWGHMKGVE